MEELGSVPAAMNYGSSISCRAGIRSETRVVLFVAAEVAAALLFPRHEPFLVSEAERSSPHRQR